jgi:hypothetical protein
MNTLAKEALAYIRSTIMMMFEVSLSTQGSVTPLRRPKLIHKDMEVPLTSVGNYSSVLTVNRLYMI